MGGGRVRSGTERRRAAGPCGTAVQQAGPGMNGTRTGMGWGARLLVALVLIIVGAAAAVLALGHYQLAARFLGIVPAKQPVLLTPKPVVMSPPPQASAVQPPVSGQAEAQKIADL